MKFEVKNGSFSYRHGQQVLREISLQLTDREILTVLGANGAGKTTLMKCMLGLYRWSAGAAYLDGREVHSLRPKEFWRQVGYVPQAKLPSFVYTVGEMVVLVNGEVRETIPIVASEAVERLNVPGIFLRFLKTLFMAG